MGRFAYQPISIEDKNFSKPGQMLADLYTGDLYTNYNNIIVSATKRIAEKIEDIDQIYNNVLEQVDVVLSLEKDYKYFIDNNLTEAYKEIMRIYSLDKEVLARYNYLKRNVDGKKDLLNAIRKYMNKLISANKYHDNLNQTYKKEVDDINDTIKDFGKYVAQQQGDALALLNQIQTSIRINQTTT